MLHDIEEQVRVFWRENKWREILKLCVSGGGVPGVLWAWPNEQGLSWIGSIARQTNQLGFTSVGCGSGLLEWLLGQATGLPVTGLELAEGWWATKHAQARSYLQQKFITMPIREKDVPKEHALVFCYFNNEDAFCEYVNAYKGKLVIVFGPAPGQNRYSAPAPLQPDFPNSEEWNLIGQYDIVDTGDIIAAWTRL